MDEHINDLMAAAGCNDLPDDDRDPLDIVRAYEETRMLLEEKSGFYVWWRRDNGTLGITDNPFKTFKDADFYRDILATLYGLEGHVVQCE